MRRSKLIYLAAGLFVFVACGREGDLAEPAPEQGTDPAGAVLATGSCVDQYSLESLADRDYAFDGTIKAIEPAAADGPDRVVFQVHGWFKGGSETEVSRSSYGVGAVTTTSTGGSALAVGERLLVAGDDEFVWECGYTQPYNENVAAEWGAALD